MDVNKEAKESLLVLDKQDGGKIKAVSGIDENGNLKTVPPKMEHEPDFLKIDKHSNPLENFFSNFMRQAKDPTHFQFFKVSTDTVENVAPVIESMAAQNTPSSEEMLSEYRVNPSDYLNGEQQSEETPQQETQQNQTEGYKPIDESRIDWDNLKQFGITRESLEKSNSLEPMLNYQKSPGLHRISANFDGVKVDTDARLAFRQTEDGRIALAVHGVCRQPELDRPYFGNSFTAEDKQHLQTTGNLGRILEIKFPNQEKAIPVFVSVDKLTNELVSVRADKIRIPNEIKGVTLDDGQKAELREGRAIMLEGMTAKSGKEFSAEVQVNADRKSIEFRFPDNLRQNQSQQNNQEFKIPQKLGGVELSDQQQSTLKEGGTIYVEGLKDRKGQEYNAYIKVNDKEQKLDFYRWNPDKAKSQEVKPDNGSATQVAVNSQGKTNEATKYQNEPLKHEQTELNQEQRQQKPKGMKM